jgi:methylthioribose-1-phosphate isomerase
MSNCTFAPGADGIRPIKYSNGVMRLIDQRLLPTEEVWLEYSDYLEVAEAIRSMVVRGAPAIGVTAAYGAYFGARAIKADSYKEFVSEFKRFVMSWPGPGQQLSTSAGPWSACRA